MLHFLVIHKHGVAGFDWNDDVPDYEITRVGACPKHYVFDRASIVMPLFEFRNFGAQPEWRPEHATSKTDPTIPDSPVELLLESVGEYRLVFE